MVAILGCGGGAAAAPDALDPAASPASSGAPPRRPDAVVLEPGAALPRSAARADARGVVALREPVGGGKVTDLVQSFLAGWQHDSLDSLAALLTRDAAPIDARARGRAGLVEGWRQRLHAHDYGRLAGVELVRPERIERWDRDELMVAGTARPAQEMLPGDIYVRVPLEVTAVAGEKLFADTLVMILRLEEGKLLIAAYGEVDR